MSDNKLPTYNSIVGCFHCDIAVLLLVVLCVYVLCTVVGSWLATSHEFLSFLLPQWKQWSNQSVS